MKTKYINNVDNLDSTPFNIAGIGAIGGLIAGQFCKYKLPVVLLLKNKRQLINYKDSELTLIYPHETFTCSPPAININNVQKEINYLIICVKTCDIINVLKKTKNSLTKNSIIILIHNGLGVMEEIKKTYPHLRFILGTSTIAAYYDSQFTIKCFMKGKIYLGALLGDFSENEINLIRKTFKKAKIHFLWKRDIHFMAWKKFAINCSINILTVLFSCKNGDLFKHTHTLEELTREVSSVLRAYGLRISQKTLFKDVISSLALTSNSYSSTFQDVRRGKKTELPYLNLYLVKLAKKKNISVELNLKLIKEFNMITKNKN